MACGTFLKVILIFINVILSLVFLAVTIIGAIMAWGEDILKSIIDQFIEPQLKQYTEQMSSSIDVNILVDFIHKCAYSIGLGLFICGLILFFICFIGIIGACCRVKAFLIIYIIFMFALITAEIVFVVIYFTDKAILLEELKKQMRKYLVKYVSIDDSGAGSVIFNLLQPHLNCCGIDNYMDFNDAPNFQRTQTYQGLSYMLAAPITCCKMVGYQIVDSSCPASFNDANSNINEGCLVAIAVATSNIANPFLYTSIAVILFQVLLVALAIALTCISKKKHT